MPLTPRSTTDLSTSPYGHLATRDVIARARASIHLNVTGRYAEVIDLQYTVKLGPKVSNYEYRVLQFLDTLPHIPTPRPIDYFDIDVPVVDDDPEIQDDPEIKGTEVWHVIVMSTIPGENVGVASHSMEPGATVVILAKVMDHMNEINSVIKGGGAIFPDLDGNWTQLESPVNYIYVDGHRGHHLKLPLYNGHPDGSVHIKDFVSTMTTYCRQPPGTADLLTSMLTYLGPANSSDIRFCHMDLQDANVLVHNGQLSGIIDWEFAGWYTWRLEVLGALKKLRGPAILLNADAWVIPDELISIIRSLDTIRIGTRRQRIAERDAGERLEMEYLRR